MKRRKFILFTVLCLSLVIFNAFTVLAYNTFNYTLDGGVGNYGNNKRYYYVTQGAHNIDSMTGTAVNNWAYTTSSAGVTTPISIVKTTTQSASVFDVYYDTSQFPNDENTIGVTQLFLYSTNVQSPQYNGVPTQNWGYSKIYINPNAFAAIEGGRKVTNGQTAYQVELGTITHEFGHAMGLAHYSNPYVIMCQMRAGRKVYQPSADDCNGINSLY